MANGILKKRTERVRKQCLHDLLDICLEVPGYGSPAVAFHKRSITISIFKLLLSEGQTGKALETSNKSMFF